MQNSSSANTQFQSDWKKEFLTQDQRLIMSCCLFLHDQNKNHPSQSEQKYSKAETAKRDALLREVLSSALLAGRHPLNTPTEGKTWRAMERTIQKLNDVQLQKLVYLVYQTKTVEEKDKLLSCLLLREMQADAQRKTKIAKLIRNLAILGSVVTLGFGSAHSDTKDQMAKTMVGAAAISTIAIGAHAQKQKKEDELNETSQTLKSASRICPVYRQLQGIIHN